MMGDWGVWAQLDTLNHMSSKNTAGIGQLRAQRRGLPLGICARAAFGAMECGFSTACVEYTLLPPEWDHGTGVSPYCVWLKGSDTFMNDLLENAAGAGHPA